MEKRKFTPVEAEAEINRLYEEAEQRILEIHKNKMEIVSRLADQARQMNLENTRRQINESQTDEPAPETKSKRKR